MGTRQETFLDYDGFVEKFKPKLTTDDCYTPPAVYDAVIAWVRKRYGIADDAQILRPFKPGGDYESEEYPKGAVVVDNPPFSICAKIVRFYQANNVPFFLFTNGLTMFGLARCAGVGFVIVKEQITFENGAVVNCGFCTNLPGANLVELAPDLSNALKEANKKSRPPTAELKKVLLPPDLITAARLRKNCIRGVEFAVPFGAAAFVAKCDCGIELFGGGLLLTSEYAEANAAAERAAAERAAAERAAAERAELSPREKELQRLIERNFKNHGATPANPGKASGR